MTIPTSLLFEPTKYNVEEDINLRQYIEKTFSEHEQHQLELKIQFFIHATSNLFGIEQNKPYYNECMEKIKRFYFEAGMNEALTNIADHEL